MSTTTSTGRRPFAPDLIAWAAEVGAHEPVAVAGGMTAWGIGGHVAASTRLTRAPSGIRSIDAAEMTVRVAAGTPVDDLDAALADVGREVALGGREGGTVGGALAVGWSDLRRARLGPSRDCLLEADVVTADGTLVRCGGPTVKNVTGYDLCRLLVGSLGTLALIGEVLLRTRPRPESHRWTVGALRPDAAAATVLRPACHLWDGSRRWLLHEGHPDDVLAAASLLDERGGTPAEGPPPLPPHRWSLDPSSLGDLPTDGHGPFVAEVGVGTVHRATPQPPRTLDPGALAVHRRLRSSFDPTSRLNPGRDPLAR